MFDLTVNIQYMAMEGFYMDVLHLIPTGLAKGGSKLEAATA